jgi:hypothetical protein
LAELRGLAAGSGWLRDAQTLETAITQGTRADASGKELDADAQRYARWDLARKQPDGGFAALREAIAGPALPGVRRFALFDLSRMGAPEARELLLQLARGGANPDLQDSALGQVVQREPQTALDLYWSLDDEHSKGYIQTALFVLRDRDRIAQIARKETAESLRLRALTNLVSVGGSAEAMQLLQVETSSRIRQAVQLQLDSSRRQIEQQSALLRTSPNPKERSYATYGLINGGDEADQSLVSAYASERDQDVKGAIVSALSTRKSFASLVALGKAESDPALKRRIVEALASGGYFDDLLK